MKYLQIEELAESWVQEKYIFNNSKSKKTVSGGLSTDFNHLFPRIPRIFPGIQCGAGESKAGGLYLALLTVPEHISSLSQPASHHVFLARAVSCLGEQQTHDLPTVPSAFTLGYFYTTRIQIIMYLSPQPGGSYHEALY